MNVQQRIIRIENNANRHYKKFKDWNDYILLEDNKSRVDQYLLYSKEHAEDMRLFHLRRCLKLRKLLKLIYNENNQK